MKIKKIMSKKTVKEINKAYKSFKKDKTDLFTYMEIIENALGGGEIKTFRKTSILYGKE